MKDEPIVHNEFITNLLQDAPILSFKEFPDKPERTGFYNDKGELVKRV